MKLLWFDTDQYCVLQNVTDDFIVAGNFGFASGYEKFFSKVQKQKA
jgi:hypothetical protein